MAKSPSYLPSVYWSSSAFLMTNSPMEVARRPTLKSPFLPWIVLIASWPGIVIMVQLLAMIGVRDRARSIRTGQPFHRSRDLREQGPELGPCRSGRHGQRGRFGGNLSVDVGRFGCGRTLGSGGAVPLGRAPGALRFCPLDPFCLPPHSAPEEQTGL